MNKLVEMAFDFLKKKIGMKNIMLIAFFSLGVYTVMIGKEYADEYIVSPQQLDEKVEKAGNIVQVQIYELQIQSLTNELYQLKKLKSKKMADEDDLDRLQEVKKQIDSTKAKKDSLQNIIYKK